MGKNILAVDDETEIADLLELYLSGEGFQVYKYYNGTDALHCLEDTPIDLALLDIMLPDIDGLSILRKIREHSFIPVIMLTAKVEEMDKITGLTFGADDYITKPFHPLEVVARVKTQLRRTTTYNQNLSTLPASQHAVTEEYDIRGLVINHAARTCSLYGETIALTPTEFELLWYLCEHLGCVVPSEELFEAVWKETYLDNNNTVMAHIARLREKLKEPARNPKFIKTVWGVGYKIDQ